MGHKSTHASSALTQRLTQGLTQGLSQQLTRGLLAGALLLGVHATALAQDSGYTMAATTPAAIAAAVSADDRPEAHTVRDANRKPAEILTLAGVKAGDKVVEFAGFGQYYTTLLSAIVGRAGEVHVFDLPYTEERAGEASRAFADSHRNTDYTLVDYNDIDLPGDVDVVFNVLYYHDLSLNDIDVAALNRRIFEALKPGGVFLIIDHNAEAGSGTRDTRELHRIDPEVIKREVIAAGFELEVDSDLLRYPEDDRSLMVFSQDTRGFTDRSVLKFRKP